VSALTCVAAISAAERNCVKAWTTPIIGLMTLRAASRRLVELFAGVR
jgi:hypothetical protein